MAVIRKMGSVLEKMDETGLIDAVKEMVVQPEAVNPSMTGKQRRRKFWKLRLPLTQCKDIIETLDQGEKDHPLAQTFGNASGQKERWWLCMIWVIRLRTRRPQFR